MTKAELVAEIAKQAGITKKEAELFELGAPHLAWEDEDGEVWDTPILLRLPWGGAEEVGYVREWEGEKEREIYFYDSPFLAYSWVRKKVEWGYRRVALPAIEVGTCEYCGESFSLSAGKHKIYELADLVESLEREGEEKMRDGYGHHAGLCYDLAEAIRKEVVQRVGKEVRGYFPVF